MPQMSPIWWFTLFLMFITTYIIFMMMLYFNKSYTMKLNHKINMKSYPNLNWKW